ncbi:response regulator [Corynebacterium uterequi]|uniref:Two component transcriptional regulator, LuxR family n=1 Tax=Corynebacterium uterequi TaxID=1072256 RepID=A0A0G3HHX0_9CORY|nr:response regulator transcription factor [Corynebacterium uterequi]AKK10722.1 two component transcriptional regulator, LuxR family [Corynebacterium uterequi]
MSEITRILLVDDDPAIIRAFKIYFETTDDLKVVAEARNGREAIDLLNRISVDLVLSDIRMPDINGIELLKIIRRTEESPVFVAITGFDTDTTMLEVLALGGAGYILKSSRPKEIIDAVRDAMYGGTALSPDCVSRLVDATLAHNARGAKRPVMRRSSPPIKINGVMLNEREEEVLRLVCEGKSNAQIAEVTHFSESTVKRHVSSLLKRFGVKTRVQLTLMLLGGAGA